MAADGSPLRFKDRIVVGPVREISLVMADGRARAMGEKLLALQQAWGTRSVAETVERAIDEAVERQAPEGPR
jgi:hypothetical protein